MFRPLQQPVELLKEVSSNIADYPTISSMKAKVYEIFEENLVLQMNTGFPKVSSWIDILQGYMVTNSYISIGVGLLLTIGLWSSFGAFDLKSVQKQTTGSVYENLAKSLELLGNKQIEELSASEFRNLLELVIMVMIESTSLSEEFSQFMGTGFKLDEETDNIFVIRRKINK